MIFLVMAEENLSAEVSTHSLQKIVLIKDFLQISFIDQKENYSYNKNKISSENALFNLKM